jgi:putative Mg2+ transporter-C (MgtC) family protein
MDVLDMNWSETGEYVLRIVIAFALALPLGWERGRGRTSVGLRTFPVVAMASCGYGLIVKSLPGADAETMARLLQGLVAGIGFIGGGAILKSGVSVRGLATAASIWNTGAIGVGMAYGREDIAVALGFINFLALLLLTPWVNRLQRPSAQDE